MACKACFISVVTAFLAHQTFSKTHSDIVYSIIIYRHGVRAPSRFYPTDPFQNVSIWPSGLTELTEEGMRGHYELGKWFRKRYSKLLPMRYNKRDISIRSTDTDRTLMSALCNLAGLYEPDRSNNWNKNIQWRPIPVHTIPEPIDKLAMFMPCPRHDELVEELLATPFFKNLYDYYKPDIDAISEATGAPITSLYDVLLIGDTLLIEDYYGLELPAWTKQYYPEPLNTMTAIIYAIPSYTPKLARLKSGPIISEMVNHMENKIDNNSSTKVRVYSAHDVTLVNIMQSLRIYDFKSPPFFAALMIELRKKKNNHFVKIFYKNSTHAKPHVLRLPGCAALCPWQHFKMLVDPIIPVDWESECNSGPDPNIT